MNVRDFLRDLSQLDREKLGHEVGSTGAYVTSCIYKKDGSGISFPLAVAIDRMSGGKVDFRTCLTKSKDIDWKYIRDVLNKRVR